jgi:hypothetical protein
MFECPKCKRCFEFGSLYYQHINRFSNCDIYLKSKYVCDFCKEDFSSKQTLERHKKNSNTKCSMFRIIQSTLADQKMLSITNVVNNNNSVLNNINNLIFAKPGEENVKHITKEVILELLNKKFENICVTLMQDAYFNRRVPKNHNWCLAYPNNGKAAVVFNYDQNEFIRDSTEETINVKFANLLELLSPIFTEIVDEENQTGFLNKTQRANLIRLQYFSNIDKLSQEAKPLHDDIRKIAYDNRKIPMKTWDDSGFKGNHLSLKFR